MIGSVVALSALLFAGTPNKALYEDDRGAWDGGGLTGGFVFASIPAMTFGAFVVPSGDFPFFFGAALPESGRGRRWSLGYQATLSVGFAERYSAGFVTHRHHLTAMNVGERRWRLFASAGGGLAFLIPYIPVIEAEGRIGITFPKRRPLTRALGVFGVLVRLGWNVGAREKLPMPQAGLFIGALVGPRRRPRFEEGLPRRHPRVR